MSRKPRKGYYVRGQFVAEGSELDQELRREQLADGPSKTELKAQSAELQALGEQLLGLRANLLEPLALPARLLDALAFLPEKHHRRADGLVTAFLDGAASTKNRSTVMLLLLYTVAEWLVIILSVAFLFGAYPGTAPLAVADIITFTAFVACGSLVQIPGIGGGVQIAAIVVLNELFHVPLELATGMAIMIWVISWIAVVPVGLALAFREGLNWRQFRALEREAAERAAAELGIECELHKVTDVNDILAFGVMMTPALVVDGAVKVVGKVPAPDEMKKYLS